MIIPSILYPAIIDPDQWSVLVDSVTVMDKKRMVWTLTGGMEVDA